MYTALIYQKTNSDDLKDYIKVRGFEAITAEDEEDINSKIMVKNFDIALLDCLEADRYDLVKKLRNISPKIAIVFMPSDYVENDEIYALRAGADFFVRRPYALNILVEKMLALLRRSGTYSTPDTYYINDYIFKPKTRELIYGDRITKLSNKESTLLELLCEHVDGLLPRDYALRSIWVDSNYFNARSMDVYVTRLRQYFSLDPKIKITNIRGKGFIFTTSA